jgi:hypothetical protein
MDAKHEAKEERIESECSRLSRHRNTLEKMQRKEERK